MYKLSLDHHIDSSHNLLNYNGACSRQHGHRWIIKVEMEVMELINDMVIDFKEIKKIIDKLDHQHINDIVSFNPTAENLAKYIYYEIASLRPFNSLSITIWESPEASITYSEDK